MTPTLLVLVSAALFIGANVLSTRFGETRNISVFFGMAVLAVLGFTAFAPLAARFGMARMCVVTDVLIALGSVLVGVLIKHEKLTFWQVTGIVFGVVAVGLIASGSRLK